MAASWGACADDGCSGGSSGLLSSITVVFHPNDGGEHIVVVDGSGSSTGEFTLAYAGPDCTTPIGQRHLGQDQGLPSPRC